MSRFFNAGAYAGRAVSLKAFKLDLIEFINGIGF